jgi:hypothetical protein
VILIAVGALLAVRPGGPARAPAAGESAPALDSQALTRIAVRAEPRVARRVERIRGLEFDSIPEPEVVESDYLNDLSAREAQSVGAYRGLAADEAELRMLGLLKPDEQLESIFGSTGDLAAAAYDTEADRLFVISDAVVANRALVEFVLAHELTHALEDQSYGLDDGAGLDDDASLALVALQEGSATSLMVDYATAHLSATDLIAATAGLDDGTDAVPDFYTDQLLWQYTGGSRFVGALRQLAGGWKLVDYALAERPPASTEQVLHPDKYVHDEQPLPVTVQTRALRRRGWRPADGGVVGELTTQQLLEVGIPHAAAQRAAAGWGGDSYEFWRRGTAPQGCEVCRPDFALVVDWRLDTEADAEELRLALGDYLEDGLEGGYGGGEWSLPGGYAAIRTAGDETALVLAPELSTAAAVAAEQVTQ